MLITHSRIWGQHWIALQKQQESGWVKVLGCCPNGCMRKYWGGNMWILGSSVSEQWWTIRSWRMIQRSWWDLRCPRQRRITQSPGPSVMAGTQWQWLKNWRPSQHASESRQCSKCMKKLKIQCMMRHLGRRWPQCECSYGQGWKFRKFVVVALRERFGHSSIMESGWGWQPA